MKEWQGLEWMPDSCWNAINTLITSQTLESDKGQLPPSQVSTPQKFRGPDVTLLGVLCCGLVEISSK